MWLNCDIRSLIGVCSEMRQPFENLVTATQHDLNRFGQDITERCGRGQTAICGDRYGTKGGPRRHSSPSRAEKLHKSPRSGSYPYRNLWDTADSQPVTCRQINVEASASMIRWINAGLMLGHRRRQWTNIRPALIQRLCLLVRSTRTTQTSATRWANVGWTLGQRRRRLSDVKPILAQRLYI